MPRSPPGFSLLQTLLPTCPSPMGSPAATTLAAAPALLPVDGCALCYHLHHPCLPSHLPSPPPSWFGRRRRAAAQRHLERVAVRGGRHDGPGVKHGAGRRGQVISSLPRQRFHGILPRRACIFNTAHEPFKWCSRGWLLHREHLSLSAAGALGQPAHCCHTTSGSLFALSPHCLTAGGGRGYSQ